MSVHLKLWLTRITEANMLTDSEHSQVVVATVFSRGCLVLVVLVVSRVSINLRHYHLIRSQFVQNIYAKLTFPCTEDGHCHWSLPGGLLYSLVPNWDGTDINMIFSFMRDTQSPMLTSRFLNQMYHIPKKNHNYTTSNVLLTSTFRPPSAAFFRNWMVSGRSK